MASLRHRLNFNGFQFALSAAEKFCTELPHIQWTSVKQDKNSKKTTNAASQIRSCY